MSPRRGVDDADGLTSVDLLEEIRALPWLGAATIAGSGPLPVRSGLGQMSGWRSGVPDARKSTGEARQAASVG